LGLRHDNMLANGPVTVFRATSKIWEFTASALLLQAGLTAPRLAGLAVGGVTGCFAALALWYGLLAALLSRSAAPPAARPTPLLPLLRLALPLFAFNACWEIYLSTNSAGGTTNNIAMEGAKAAQIRATAVFTALPRDRAARHMVSAARMRVALDTAFMAPTTPRRASAFMAWRTVARASASRAPPAARRRRRRACRVRRRDRVARPMVSMAATEARRASAGISQIPTAAMPSSRARAMSGLGRRPYNFLCISILVLPLRFCIKKA
jgi:hypothetical protein